MFEFGIVLIYMLGLGAVWAAAGFFIVRRRFDPAFIFLALGAYTIIFPASFYLLAPEALASQRFLNGFTGPLLLQCLIVTVFFAGILAGYLTFARPRLIAALFPAFTTRQIRPVILTGIALMSAISLAMAVFVLHQGGGLFSAIQLVRHSGDLDSFNFLRQFIRLGTFLCIAFLLESLLRKRAGLPTLPFELSLSSVFLGINLFAALMTGGKSYVIYPLFTLILAYVLYFRKSSLKSLIAPLIVLMTLILALQYGRTVFVAQSDFNSERQVLTGIGASNLDTNLIYLDYIAREKPVETGGDFYNGVLGVIPRMFWQDKPGRITAGGAFRRSVDPGSNSGWPVFGFNIWYSNFGWIGVVLGGFLSGVLLRSLAYRYEDYPENPYSFCLLTLFTIHILVPGGMSNLILMQYILNVLPLWIFVLFSSRAFIPRSVLRA